ncbi:MAG: Crp/Fnr family transcriptional regulator, partial [Pseudomonadota bacterium]
HTERGANILNRGDRQRHLIMIVSGWAARCRYTRAGSRQIQHILLPGDVATPDVFVIDRSDHDIQCLSDCQYRLVEPAAMRALFRHSEAVASAMWWSAEQEDGILREHIVRLGRRAANERVPHLFLELHRRLVMVDQATEDTFLLPLTQADIADALGLSAVHVNRTLRNLSKDGFIDYAHGIVTVHDPVQLAEYCDFDISHLHLDSHIVEERLDG